MSSVSERPRHDVEPRDVASRDVRQRSLLDRRQRFNDRPRCRAARPSQADQERSPIGVVESAANQPSRFEPIEDPAQRGRTVPQVALQLSNGVRCAVGKQGDHMDLALRHTGFVQEFLEAHAGRVSRPLQLDDHETIRCGGVLSRSR
jgi:hypothetical protein